MQCWAAGLQHVLCLKYRYPQGTSISYFVLVLKLCRMRDSLAPQLAGGEEDQGRVWDP